MFLPKYGLLRKSNGYLTSGFLIDVIEIADALLASAATWNNWVSQIQSRIKIYAQRLYKGAIVLSEGMSLPPDLPW